MNEIINRYVADILENLELILLCVIGFHIVGKALKVVIALIAAVALGLMVYVYANGGVLYGAGIDVEALLEGVQNIGTVGTLEIPEELLPLLEFLK